MSHNNKPFYGENECQNEKCKNKAYWEVVIDEKTHFLCGVHCRNKQRVLLPKDPDAPAKRLMLWKSRIEAAMNPDIKQTSKIICIKLRMMKSIPYTENYLNVLPNYRHGNRMEGFGCPDLSPMNLGPIKWGPLPICRNLENFYQTLKVYPHEAKDGKLTKEFWDLLKERFASEKGYRHKFGYGSPKPLYAINFWSNGIMKKYTYVESRYFYCHWYEKLAKETKSFKKLKEFQERGVNLQIVGYDGHAIEKGLYDYYIDDSRPFGHELVLYSMLTIENEEEYPWNVYKIKHKSLYG